MGREVLSGVREGVLEVDYFMKQTVVVSETRGSEEAAPLSCCDPGLLFLLKVRRGDDFDRVELEQDVSNAVGKGERRRKII